MKLGISEILLIALICLILFGPTVIPMIYRWYRRAGDYGKRAEKQRRVRAIQVKAVRDEFLHRCAVAAAIVFGGAAIVGIAYICFAPCTYEPQPFTQNSVTQPVTAETQPGQTISLGRYQNPIAVAEQDGWLYAAVDSGSIVRVRADGTGLSEVFSTGGDVTGLAFAPDGTLYLLDVDAGGGGALMRASFDGWAVSAVPVVTAVNGRRLACPVALCAAPDGSIYFTDYAGVSAAGIGFARAMVTEQLARTGGGSVYRYDPATGETVCVAKNVAGAGGVAVDAAGKTLYLSESEAARVWALPLDAENADIAAGDAALVLDGTAGYPAGIAADADGTLWVALCGERTAWLEGTASMPFVRRMVMHLPYLTQRWLAQPHAKAGRAAAIRADGTPYGFACTEASHGRITGICPTENGLWMANADGNTLYFVRP